MSCCLSPPAAVSAERPRRMMQVMANPPLRGSVLARATSSDAAELWVLQRCCWVSEAIANNTLQIPALHEDLHVLTQWVKNMDVWCVRIDSRLVGAVRTSLTGESWQIGRLMVAPDLVRQGLGRWLLEFAERRAPERATQCKLFTGAQSARNLRMYTQAGYVESAGDETSRPSTSRAQYVWSRKCETTSTVARNTIANRTVSGRYGWERRLRCGDRRSTRRL